MRGANSNCVMAKKILIGCGDNSLQNRAEKLLSDEGYQVYAAKSGIEALVAVANIRPDLVFIDMLLPPVKAHPFCLLIKQNIEFRSIPVVTFSKTAGIRERARSASLSIIDHIVTPFEDRELLRVADQYANI